MKRTGLVVLVMFLLTIQVAFAQQMSGMTNPAMMGQQVQMQQPSAPTPPPMPTQIQYFYASNNQQLGPVNFEQLKVLFANRTINKDSLVWKQGMASWTALKDVEELKSFLGGNTPPPLPGN